MAGACSVTHEAQRLPLSDPGPGVHWQAPGILAPPRAALPPSGGSFRQQPCQPLPAFPTALHHKLAWPLWTLQWPLPLHCLRTWRPEPVRGLAGPRSAPCPTEACQVCAVSPGTATLAEQEPCPCFLEASVRTQLLLTHTVLGPAPTGGRGRGRRL